MSKQLRELQARKATLVKDARALTDMGAVVPLNQVRRPFPVAVVAA